MTPKCYCGSCDRDVPANVDGTPMRHPKPIPGTDGKYIHGMCPGGSNLHGVIMSDPMALALVLDLKTSTLRNSPRWANAEKGDRIYAKEAWRPLGPWTSLDPLLEYRADGARVPWKGPGPLHVEAGDHAWKNSMFAPFSACRTIRTLTAKPHLVRPQDLTLDQIMAEGVRVLVHPAFRMPVNGKRGWSEARSCAGLGDWRAAFSWMWIAINGRASLEANEPAWLIEFEGAKS